MYEHTFTHACAHTQTFRPCTHHVRAFQWFRYSKHPLPLLWRLQRSSPKWIDRGYLDRLIIFVKAPRFLANPRQTSPLWSLHLKVKSLRKACRGYWLTATRRDSLVPYRQYMQCAPKLGIMKSRSDNMAKSPPCYTGGQYNTLCLCSPCKVVATAAWFSRTDSPRAICAFICWRIHFYVSHRPVSFISHYAFHSHIQIFF